MGHQRGARWRHLAGDDIGLNRLSPPRHRQDIDKWSAYLTHDAIGGTNINDVVLDSAGRVWATAAKNTSLNILDPVTNRWQAQLTCPEAGYPGVLAADSAGRIWVDRELGLSGLTRTAILSDRARRTPGSMSCLPLCSAPTR